MKKYLHNNLLKPTFLSESSWQAYWVINCDWLMVSSVALGSLKQSAVFDDSRETVTLHQ